MKLKKIRCPNCDGVLDIKLDNKEYIFCPYCGDKFFIDDEKKEYTINQNIHIKKDININKHTSHTNRYIDDADVIRAKTKDREQKYSWIGWVSYFLVCFILLGICAYMIDEPEREAKKAISAGKISAGSYEDYEGDNYQAVFDQLEALGFENITCIDLDDAGLMFWLSDDVECVSIGGDTSFSRYDYFDPDEVVIIKYH